MTKVVSKRIRWRDALVAQVLSERQPPVVSSYWLALKVFQLTQLSHFDGRPLQMPERGPDQRMFTEARNALISRGVLHQSKGLHPSLYRTSNEPQDAAELMCAIDPFGYVAYLSAMAYHGLTNRLPKVLYFVSPNPHLWKDLAQERMRKDLGSLYGDFVFTRLPRLRHFNIEKIDGVVIEEIRTKERRGWRSANDGALRVTGIGNTFLDMLQRADICGGMRHVIDVFEEHARLHLSSIVTAVNTHGSVIDKMRAGYILETHCGIDSPEVDAWAALASRGGSRKLDPQGEYSSEFSSKWCISINV
ncbi:hypothetical protein [Stenotrophomonas sp. SMYL11]|uniref:type IV toxin-antitoxin system AbiEi family antitoxin domain-containing protein n=1 Tax=Stenotrophomonas sp. SMYL11 TaxID=3076042 RepID=UPI002E7A52F6|nr:hypothetical protein [Stenotrophomonas sp. SMYL11]